jgi:signal transduction histidine kinase
MFTTGMSLRWRLPAIMLTLLVSIGVAFAWTAHREMRRALRQAGEDRIRNAATPLADLLAQGATARVAENRRLADDPAIRRFVQSGESPDAAMLALRTARERSLQSKIDLKAWGGTTVTRLASENVTLERSPRPPGASSAGPEGIGPLRVENGRIVYSSSVSVPAAAGDPASGSGVVTIDRPISPGSGVVLVQRLIGSGAVLKFGNTAGDVWTDLTGPIAGPPSGPLREAISFADAQGTRHLGAAVPIPGTPWQVWVEFVEGELMRPAQTLLRLMLPWTALLVLLGVVGAWVVSARTIAPLEHVAKAADAIASGDYSRRLVVTGRDEISRLASAFNVMAAHVAESQEVLEARVQARTRELNQSREELQKYATNLSAANSELEAFSYSVSHDLRAPLRGIDGFSQALIEDCGERMGEDGMDYLRRIRKAAQHMGCLLDDLLKLARVTRAELRFETIDLSAMAETTLQALSEAHKDRTVDWRVEPGLRAAGDARLMQIALTHLLENAWKFTGKRAQAQIEFGMRRDSGGAGEYFVRDNGAGFDPVYSAKLFAAFQRLHHAAEFPGTGIGLATVQRIVSRHGGQVRAEGAIEQGATFTFTLQPESPTV